MYVVIVGAGEVGSYLARILSSEGHEVAVIELNEERARKLDASLDVLVVRGSGVHPSSMKDAGLAQADLLLAVTATDEVNLITCMTGEKYGREELRTLARVRQSPAVAGELSLSAQDLGLDALISPEQAITAATINVLRYSGSGEMRELAEGRLALVGMVLGEDSPLVHETLAELRKDFPGEFLVVAAQGQDGVRIPAGEDRLLVTERAYVLALPESLTELAILSGHPWHHVHRVLIVGCGNTGLALARELGAEGFETTIVESDRDRAELVAGLLPKALVLHGDGADPELVRDRVEEDDVDAVVVLLEEAEKSVLVGIYAKSLGVRKVVVRCDVPGYVPLTNLLGVDSVISPKRAMADATLQYVRGDAVESTLLLGEHEAEVLRFRVPAAPKRRALVERPLKDLGFPRGSLVGAVIRPDQVLIGSGNTVLRPGDELLVVCRPDVFRQVERILA